MGDAVGCIVAQAAVKKGLVTSLGEGDLWEGIQLG